MSASLPNVNGAEQKAQPDPVALFISDLHLQPALPKTTEAFFTFLRVHAVKARQLYLLGDIFEYWAGDDDIGASSYAGNIVDALRKVSDAGIEVSWIGGNRDFLVGEEFAVRAGLCLLPDPSVIKIASQQIILTHGDALCTDDREYLLFRSKVRDPAWQRDFLSQPLAQRKKIIEELRIGSREAQRNKSMSIMDANPHAIEALFKEQGAALMIHGHTHRPARHEIKAQEQTYTRFVLPDWDCENSPQRGGWIAMDAQGGIRRYGANGIELP